MGTRHIEIEQMKSKMQAEFDQLVSQMRQDFDKMMLGMGGKKPKDKHRKKSKDIPIEESHRIWDKVCKRLNGLSLGQYSISEKGIMPVQIRVTNIDKDDYVFEVGKDHEGYYYGSHVLPDIKVPYNADKLKHILDIMLECYQKHVSVL